jgi:hemolysin III
MPPTRAATNGAGASEPPLSTSAKRAAAELVAVKPSQRGVLHTYAAVVAPVAGILLTLEGPTARARWGLLLYALSLTVQFTASATYHRPTWDPARRRIMKAIDHAAIYILIAGKALEGSCIDTGVS